TLPARFMVRGFEALCFVSLSLAGGMLLLFLRRLRHGELAALPGVVGLRLSGRVAESVRVPILGEPVAVLLQLAFVVALEAGARLGGLALLPAPFTAPHE